MPLPTNAGQIAPDWSQSKAAWGSREAVPGASASLPWDLPSCQRFLVTGDLHLSFGHRLQRNVSLKAERTQGGRI